MSKMDESVSQVNCPIETGKSRPPRKLHLSAEKIPVELYKQDETKSNWERRGKIAADFGPSILGIASLIISLIALSLSYLVSDRQDQLKKQEVDTAATELRLKFLAELNDKVFSELNDKDYAKRQLAAIRLASFGETALPSLGAALGVQDPNVRTGAVEVVSQMFRSDAAVRKKLTTLLLTYSQAKNLSLRRSALECFVEVIEELDSNERQQIANTIKERMKSEDCSTQDGEYVIVPTVVFVGNSGSPDAAKLLLGVAENVLCTVPSRRAAIDRLPGAAAQSSAADRSEILNRLQNLKDNAHSDLKVNREQAIKKMGTP